MSALLAVVSSVAPSVTPVVHAIVSTPTPTPTPDVLQTLNNAALQVPDAAVVAVSGFLAMLIQIPLNKVSFFNHAVEYVKNVRRFTLAVFIPGLLAVGASLASGTNDLGLMPAVFLVAQVAFRVGQRVYESLRARLISELTPTEPVL